MAERRMFSKSVTSSDSFLDMSCSARMLYFALGMAADDDGFIRGPKGVMRLYGCTDEDLQDLVDSRFIFIFKSGTVLIRHWKVNNLIQKDRYKPGTVPEKNMVTINEETKEYELDEKMVKNCIQNVSELYPSCIQNGYKTDTNCIQNGYKAKIDTLKTEQNKNIDKTNKIADSNACIQNGYKVDTQAGYKVDTQVSIGKYSIDKDSIAAAAAKPDILTFYEENIRPVTSQVEAEKICDLESEYGPEWLKEAIKEAALNHAASTKYIAAILARWKTIGAAEPWEAHKTAGKKRQQSAQELADDALRILESGGVL